MRSLTKFCLGFTFLTVAFPAGADELFGQFSGFGKQSGLGWHSGHDTMTPKIGGRVSDLQIDATGAEPCRSRPRNCVGGLPADEWPWKVSRFADGGGVGIADLNLQHGLTVASVASMCPGAPWGICIDGQPFGGQPRPYWYWWEKHDVGAEAGDESPDWHEGPLSMTVAGPCLFEPGVCIDGMPADEWPYWISQPWFETAGTDTAKWLDNCGAMRLVAEARCELEENGWPKITSVEPAVTIDTIFPNKRWIDACGSLYLQPGATCEVDENGRPKITDVETTVTIDSAFPYQRQLDACGTIYLRPGATCEVDENGRRKIADMKRISDAHHANSVNELASREAVADQEWNGDADNGKAEPVYPVETAFGAGAAASAARSGARVVWKEAVRVAQDELVDWLVNEAFDAGSRAIDTMNDQYQQLQDIDIDIDQHVISCTGQPKGCGL
jgi:hypothetical protein